VFLRKNDHTLIYTQKQTQKQIKCTVPNDDSMYSTTTSNGGGCPNCMDLEHRQNHLDIQLQTVTYTYCDVY